MPAAQTPPRIQRGIPPDLRNAAAALYWRHFGAQILPWPATARQGVALIRAAMRPERALVALAPSGRLVGIAGLREAGGGFL
ncbi:GNAT family N-acetyltransferase, partial [Paracoccus sp. PXZ]